MPAFAIYYIPDFEDPFYQLGSSILGYDIRKKEDFPIPKELNQWRGGISEEWVEIARPYGFHCTIGDAIECELSTIYKVERELETLLGCFSADNKFTLTQRDDFVTFWGDNRQVIFLRYDANVELMMFQAAIVASINTMGTGSGYLRTCLESPELYSQIPEQINRTKKYFAPYVFDRFRPHFTLLSPFLGEGHDELKNTLEDMFLPFKKFTVDKIALLFQKDLNSNWEIYREFER